jgi:GNAT superfamily N-acetyltransferase
MTTTMRFLALLNDWSRRERLTRNEERGSLDCVCRGARAGLDRISSNLAMAYNISTADAARGATRLSYLPLARRAKAVDVVVDYATEAELPFAHGLLNAEIREGLTWPHEKELDEAEFRAYFLTHALFVVRDAQGAPLSCFYVKPNFPGRCSHVCNGGFIVSKEHRGLGLGRLMATLFPYFARDLGYKSSLFNLVFVTNARSHALWSSIPPFTKIGVVPKVHSRHVPLSISCSIFLGWSFG